MYVLREDDNVTLSFQTSEQIDQPDVTLSIGGRPVDNSSYSVFFDHEGGTAQGTSWKASYRIRDNDSGVLFWSISGYDRGGNALKLDSTDNISSLNFSSYDNFSYESDTQAPSLIPSR